MNRAAGLFLAAFAVFSCLLVANGCSSSQPTEAKKLPLNAPDWQKEGLTPEQRDETARAALEASDKWTAPRCRFLRFGARLTETSTEMEMYRTARDLGFINMELRGDNGGAAFPVYDVTVTEAGKSEAADCKVTYSERTLPIPVSRRKLLAFTYAGEAPNYGRMTYYTVDFEWQPTHYGELVKDRLTKYDTVEEGKFQAKVTMNRYGKVWNVIAVVEPRMPQKPDSP